MQTTRGGISPSVDSGPENWCAPKEARWSVLKFVKLRIKENSVRLRLTRSEVADLAAVGVLENVTDFGNHSFRFSVLTRKDGPILSSDCRDGAIRIEARKLSIEQWAASETVGLYAEQPALNGAVLTIALEKDFRCLDPRRDEDESDHFANPLAGASHQAGCQLAPG